MTDSPRSVAPTSEEWQRRLDAAQAEALADLARWSNPLSVPPPLEPEGADSGPVPTLAQAEQAKAALAREFPAWSIWYGTRWYAAGPCPCAPTCTGRRTLHALTAEELRTALEDAARRRRRQPAEDAGEVAS